MELGERELLTVANDLFKKPESTDKDQSPVHPVVRGSANQTNARTAPGKGMVPVQKFADGTDDAQPAPEVPAAATSDPGWAARMALNNTLNPPGGGGQVPDPQIAQFSRALPANGAPTPTFATAPATPAGQAADSVAALIGHGVMHVLGKNAGQSQGTATPVQPPGQDPAPQPDNRPHPINAPHLYSRDEFINGTQGVPMYAFEAMNQMTHTPGFQQQAQARLMHDLGGNPDAVGRLLDMFAVGPENYPLVKSQLPAPGMVAGKKE